LDRFLNLASTINEFMKRRKDRSLQSLHKWESQKYFMVHTIKIL